MRFGIKKDCRIIGYFAQNPGVPGHTHNFVTLLNAISEYQKEVPCKLLFRAHPAWRDQYDSYWKRIENMNIDTIDVTDEPFLEELLYICDIVTSCYSTVAVDHAYLSCYMRTPIGVALYLLCGDEIKNYLCSEYGYWKNPLLDRGIGIYVDDYSKLYETVKSISASDAVATDYFMRTKALQIDSPCEKIIKIVSFYLSK